MYKAKSKGYLFVDGTFCCDLLNRHNGCGEQELTRLHLPVGF